MNTLRIPCTVQLLTRDAAGSIDACLAKFVRFAEVLVQDGYSQDATVAIAKKYDNVRVILQPKEYLDANRRITHYSEVRNDGIRQAAYDWIFVVDADEVIDAGLVEEVARIIASGEPAVFQARRIFYVQGQRINQCSAYPSLQIRLFHRSLIEGYRKSVHERILLKPGVEMQILHNELPIALPTDPSTLWPKYERYLALDIARMGCMSWSHWYKHILVRNIKTILGFLLRTVSIRLRPWRGKILPWSYERQFLRYAFITIVRTWPPRVHRLLKNSAIRSQT